MSVARINCSGQPPSASRASCQKLMPRSFVSSTDSNGSIPIIQRFPGDSIYDGLPVVRLDDLPSDQLTPANLRRWRAKFAPAFEGDRRRAVLETLTADHWWGKITRAWTQNGTRQWVEREAPSVGFQRHPTMDCHDDPAFADAGGFPCQS